MKRVTAYIYGHDGRIESTMVQVPLAVAADGLRNEARVEHDHSYMDPVRNEAERKRAKRYEHWQSWPPNGTDERPGCNDLSPAGNRAKANSPWSNDINAFNRRQADFKAAAEAPYVPWYIAGPPMGISVEKLLGDMLKLADGVLYEEPVELSPGRWATRLVYREIDTTPWDGAG